MTTAWLDARGSMRTVALLRILLGLVTLLHLRPFLSDVVAGHRFADRFHEPFVEWYPEPSHPLHGVLLWVGAGAAVLLTVGLFTRVAAVVTWAVVTYNLFLSETHFHQNRSYLVLLLGGLALLPSGRVLSVDAVAARRRGRPLIDEGPLWPVWLLRIEVSAVYLASGLGKLVDGDWWGGTVTWDRVVQVRDQVEASVLPPWAVDLLLDRDFHTIAAKVIILTELAIGLGLWWRRTRPYAIGLAVCFHVAIELTASVQVFSLLAVAALLVWLPPRPAGEPLRPFLRTPGARARTPTIDLVDTH